MLRIVEDRPKEPYRSAMPLHDERVSVIFSLIKDLSDEFWIALDDVESKTGDLGRSRAWSLAGLMLKELHVAVRHGLSDIVDIVSDVVVKNLDDAYRHGKTVALRILRGQLLRCVIPWCEVDLSPDLLLQSHIGNSFPLLRRKNVRALRQSSASRSPPFCGNPQRRRDVLEAKVEAMTSSNKSDDMVEMIQVIRRPREAPGGEKEFTN